MSDNTRSERVADQIQILMSEALHKNLRDPRLQGVTVTEVLIDRELQHANVYVNALGDDDRKDEIMAGLESASGFLRRQVAHGLQLRNAPQIKYHWDPRLQYIEEVDALLGQLEIPPEVPSEEPAEDDSAA